MTWKRATLLVAVVLLAGCAKPGAAASTAHAPRCADLVAHAMTTQPPQPVAGAFACLDAAIQEQAQGLGVSDDASWAEYAKQTPVFIAYRYVGFTADVTAATRWYYFELTPQVCYRLSVDSHGLVNGGSFGPQGQPCPKPLP